MQAFFIYSSEQRRERAYPRRKTATQAQHRRVARNRTSTTPTDDNGAEHALCSSVRPNSSTCLNCAGSNAHRVLIMTTGHKFAPPLDCSADGYSTWLCNRYDYYMKVYSYFHGNFQTYGLRELQSTIDRRTDQGGGKRFLDRVKQGQSRARHVVCFLASFLSALLCVRVCRGRSRSSAQTTAAFLTKLRMWSIIVNNNDNVDDINTN